MALNGLSFMAQLRGNCGFVVVAAQNCWCDCHGICILKFRVRPASQHAGRMASGDKKLSVCKLFGERDQDIAFLDE
jgi:hypothetical protein